MEHPTVESLIEENVNNLVDLKENTKNLSSTLKHILTEVAAASRRERDGELLAKLDRFGGFDSMCRDRFKDIITKKEH